MSRQRLDQICGTAILGIVLLIVAFGPLMMGATRGQDIAVIGILTTIAATLWGARLWLRPQIHIAWPPLCFAVLGFVVYALYRYPDAPVEYAARNEVLRILIYALIFFIVLNNATHRSLSVFSYLIIGLGVFMSIYAVYQFMTRSDMVWNLVRPAQYAGRGSGTYICPNHLAGYLEMAIPLGLAQLFVSRKGHTGRVAIAYAVLAMFAGLGVTVSRGGWVATAVGLVAFFAILARRSGFRGSILVLFSLLVAVGLALFNNPRLIESRSTPNAAWGLSGDARVHIWRAATDLWLEHPVAGIGPGQFDSEFSRHRPPQLQGRAVYVHNDYLNTLTEWGLLGFGIVGFFFVAFFLSTRGLWLHLHTDSDDPAPRDSNRAAFVVAGVAATVSLLTHSFVDFNFQIPANAILLLTLVAMIGAIGLLSRVGFVLKPTRPGKAAVTAVLAMICGCLLPESVLKYREGTRLAQADHPDISLQTEIRLLQEMREIEPMNPDTAYRLGEGYRLLNWEKPPGYYGGMLQAIGYFETAVRLDPANAFAWVRHGMCLDLLRRYAEAGKSFLRAGELDPHGAFTAGHIGWHYLQIDEYGLARKHLERSLALNWWDNEFAREQLEILDMFTGPAPASTGE